VRRLPAACPLRSACTAARHGRTIAIHPHQAILQRARATQRDPAWQQRYRADRPIVERKIAHFTRRAWGGRRARTRGLDRITTDLLTRAAALNWARLAVLGLGYDQAGWALHTT
jgi:Transposase DDE domain